MSKRKGDTELSSEDVMDVVGRTRKAKVVQAGFMASLSIEET